MSKAIDELKLQYELLKENRKKADEDFLWAKHLEEKKLHEIWSYVFGESKYKKYQTITVNSILYTTSGIDVIDNVLYYVCQGINDEEVLVPVEWNENDL